MANDRVWLRCTTCGDQLLVAKYYPQSWIIWTRGVALERFVAEHLEHHPRDGRWCLAGDPGLAFETESDPSDGDIE